MGLGWNGTGSRVMAAKVRETFKLLLSLQAAPGCWLTSCPLPADPAITSLQLCISTRIRQKLGLDRGLISCSGYRASLLCRFSHGAEPFPFSDKLRDLPPSQTAGRPDAVLVCLLPSASAVGYHFLPDCCAVQLLH